MAHNEISFVPVEMSLTDLLGREYVEAACRARSALRGDSYNDLMAVSENKVEFLPARFQERMHALMGRVGTQVCSGLRHTATGASSRAYNASTKTELAPLSGMGYYRVGEDGKLYMSTKSAHYHAPLGHNFPGYAILETARSLGIPNATHNNTRGCITRWLEEKLIRTAGSPTLNCVLNLETGSLAVEAALKMVLSPFYRIQKDDPEPHYKGRIPVLVVVGNDNGGLQANYHGTTLLMQTLRGMWSELYTQLEDKAYLIRSVRPNNMDDLRSVFREYDSGKYKIAAFFHEIVMMNYAGLLLTPEFLGLAYELCRKSGTATVDDEIQSCAWHHDLFMFKEWGLQPDFVALGKGFTGGEYPASRILFNKAYDRMPQFGALVTNGQEEIASLAYLVTIAWVEANAETTRMLGDRFEERLQDLACKHGDLIASLNGKRHMLAIAFNDIDLASELVGILNGQGIDISVQTYKTEVPPAAMLKLPLIMDATAIDWVVERIDEAIYAAKKRWRKDNNLKGRYI